MVAEFGSAGIHRRAPQGIEKLSLQEMTSGGGPPGLGEGARGGFGVPVLRRPCSEDPEGSETLKIYNSEARPA